MRKNLKIWRPDLCNISDEAIIGDDVIIHSGVVIYEQVVIGNRCKIQSGVFIPNLITIKDDVFVGPNSIFLNDKMPPSNGRNWEPIIINNGVTIGGGVVILPGITIGENAMIGAGSVVTKPVPAGECWIGNPAKFYKKVKNL